MKFLVLAGLLYAGSLSAQSPAQREHLARFRDSLATRTDTAAMAELESRLIDVARIARDSTLLHLELGLVALRMADLGSRSRYGDAASEFQWAIDLEPEWPWPWYGLGLAEAGIGGTEYSLFARLQALFSVDHRTLASENLTRSVKNDPAFIPGVIGLAENVSLQRLNADHDNLLRMVRQAGSTDAAAGSAEYQLTRGRVERVHGDADSAIRAFRRYLDLAGPGSLGQLELARTRLMTGDTSAQKAWYSAAESVDPEVVEGIRDDISFVARDSELVALEAASGPELVKLLHDFWDLRAAQSLRTPGERLAEHYRRLYYARRNFVRGPTKRRYYGPEFYESRQMEFDDRGELYIRHGPPDERVVNMGGGCANESWRYDRSDGPFVLHFRASRDALDYRLVASVFDLICDAGDAPNILQTRLELDQIYQDMAFAGVNQPSLRNEEWWRGRESIKQSTSSDEFLLDFDEPLRVLAQILSVGRDSEGATVHVVYAVRSDNLEARRGPGGEFLYPVRLRFAVVNPEGEVVQTLDTVTTYSSGTPVPEGRLLAGRARVTLPAGEFEYHLAIQQSQAGLLFPTGSLKVEPSGGNEFSVSDLVLGDRAMQLTWRPAPADTVFFNPTAVFSRNADLELYYELYGLNPGTSYRTELVVEKQEGGGLFGLFGKPEPIKLSFTDQAAGPVTRVQRTIDLSGLDPGAYVLEIRTTDKEGVERIRRQPFAVSEAARTVR